MTQGLGFIDSGILHVTGRDRVDLLHRLSTKDLRPLRPGMTTSTLFTTNQGRLVDWVQIYCREDHLLLRTSQGRGPTLKAWIERYTIMEDVTVQDVSESLSTAILWGDLHDVPAVEEGHVFIEGSYVWARGLAAYGPRSEVVLPRTDVATLQARFSHAKLADAQTLERERILAGVPSPEHEFEDEVNPLELRLTQHAVSWNKGCYIGQEVISRLDSYDKVARVLIGFETPEMLVNEGELKLTREGKPLGRVTSLCTLSEGGSIGLAVVKRDAVAGESAAIGDTRVILVDRPFWTQKGTP